MMRVISGKAKGHKLLSVPGDATRPITDRVKESLFNIIGPDVQGSVFLDLFAGTGSVGIEALSRGAARAYFIDLNQQAIKTIEANLRLTGFQDLAEILRVDAISYLQSQPEIRFDYVFIAPPQYQGTWLNTLRLIDSNPVILSEDAWVIVQIHPREYEDPHLSRLFEFDRRTYGSTSLYFYQTELS